MRRAARLATVVIAFTFVGEPLSAHCQVDATATAPASATSTAPAEVSAKIWLNNREQIETYL